MRGVWTIACAVAAVAAASANAPAHNIATGSNLVRLYSSSESSPPISSPQDVQAGQVVMITGECLGDDENDVRIVLSLADRADATWGYHEMLVTEQERANGKLVMRVPNLPETRDHVFNVRLFVGEDDPSVCDAGRIRIV